MSNVLGKEYQHGEIVVRQGDEAYCMFVIQAGRAEVIVEDGGSGTLVDVMGPGEVFGEMAILDPQPRTATIRALGTLRALTIDKKTFLRRVQEDPTLALSILRSLSARVKKLDAEIASMRGESAEPAS